MIQSLIVHGFGFSKSLENYILLFRLFLKIAIVNLFLCFCIIILTTSCFGMLLALYILSVFS